jgi:plasmid stability protein
MSRTTLKLDEDLLRRLKERAAREGRTLQSLANDLLRRGLVESPRREYRLELRTWPGKLRPGVDLFDRDSLFDAMEDR